MTRRSAPDGAPLTPDLAGTEHPPDYPGPVTPSGDLGLYRLTPSVCCRTGQVDPELCMARDECLALDPESIAAEMVERYGPARAKAIAGAVFELEGSRR